MAFTINLPEHIQAYIRKQAEEGRFASEEAAKRGDPVSHDVTY